VKKKENILLIIGILLLAFVLYMGGSFESGLVKTEGNPQATIDEKEIETSPKSICKIDGLECLYVGCNDYY
jgi:hypothetical protein